MKKGGSQLKKMPKDSLLIEIKMQNKWLYLMVVSLLFSCGEQVLEPPEKLIPKDTMVSILTELTIINAAKTTNVAILRKNEIEPMTYLFEKYKVDSLQFVMSDRYYASLPLEYEDIHAQVQKSIEKQAEEIILVKKVNDSLKLAKSKEKRGANKKKGKDKNKKPKISLASDSLQ